MSDVYVYLMKIEQVNQIDGHGGAAGICLALHKAISLVGHQSFVLVGRQYRNLSGVKKINHECGRSGWSRFWMHLARWVNSYSGRIRGAQRVSERWIPYLVSPKKFWSWWLGHEDFDFPGTKQLLKQAPFIPDVLHLHNLHGDFFDLRELPTLSRTVPTIITLHDTWLLAGHCAYFVDCRKWESGCSSCPHLDFEPVIRRDGASFNWLRKLHIYQKSHLTLVCPSQWLANEVSQSILMRGANRLKVIPNGVDTSIFKPGIKASARNQLGWPQDAFIVMFAANSARSNMWKDYNTMREAVRLAGEKTSITQIRFFAIGDTAPSEQAGSVRIEFLPYRDSMAECYQAADVFLHAAKADNFPTTILESLACGTPVIATAVGGITEQIIDGKTGFLVPAGDAPAMAERLVNLAQSPDLLHSFGMAASRDAANRFSLEQMGLKYIELYKEMIEQREKYCEN